MSATAIQLYGPRGEKLAPSRRHYGGGNNSLFQTATQTQDRKSITSLDYDVHRTVTNTGRRTMMTLGRKIFSDFRAIGATVEEKAELASSCYLPQFYGANKEWGTTAEAWLENHDSICDVAGPPYNLRHYRRLLIISVIRDGDALTVLVKNKDGYPFLQVIPAHRIGSAFDCQFVQGGEYDGARIIDGVILDGVNRAIAYRVNTGENPYDYTQFVDIPARDAFLSFIPRFVGQVRGFSELGMVAFDAQDVHESDFFQRLQQKLASSVGLIEHNETGEGPAPGDTSIPVSTAPTGTQLTKETVTDSGLTIRYFRSGDPNARIETLANDQPSANQQAYRSSVLRDVFSALGWSIDFSLDPTKIGGASARFMVDRINRQIEAVQDLILEPACVRFDGFRVSSAIQLGLLPKDVDWWKWTYQGPSRLTADKKYDIEVDAREEQLGYATRAQKAAARGNYIDDVDAAKIASNEAKWTAAQKAAQKFGVPIETMFNAMWMETPNGIQAQKPEPAGAMTE